MAEQDKEQRTEQATPRKREKLREEGKVIKSQDVNGAAVLIGVALCFSAIGEHAAIEVLEFGTRAFSLRDAREPLTALSATLPVFAATTLPVLVTAFLAAAAVGVVQSKGLFSLKLLAIKPERLNPIPQLKNILPSKQSLLELSKQLLKILALGAVVYNVVSDATPEFAVLASSGPAVAAATVGTVATRVAVHGGAAFALVAVFDYFLAKRKFDEDAKMSMQDIRDEHKEQEGRPEVKNRMRQLMREQGKHRGIAEVKDASVLVCNPTHIAVALRYEPEKDAAPIMLTKGVEQMALRMRVEARKHGVPIVENRPLARALHADGAIGAPIPVDLYRAAAEVIAHIMRLRGGLS